MRFPFWFVQVLLGATLMVSSSSVPSGKVVELTSKDFDAEIGQGIWLVEFYAPWCGHCRKLAPIYEQVAQELQGKVHVAKVDGTKNRALSSRFGVTGFPSIFLIRDGNAYEYKEARSKKMIANFPLEGYKNAQPLGYFGSPIGPVGRLKGRILGLGVFMVESYTYLRDDYGLTQNQAGVVIALIIFSCTLLLVAFLVYIMAPTGSGGARQPPREHAPPAEHPHQD